MNVRKRLAIPLRLATLCFLLGTASAAQAGIFPGHLDPNSDGFVPAYNADLLFDIPNSCLAGTGYTATPDGVTCGPASVIAATVNLYADTPYGAPPTGPVLGTINWPGSASIIGVAHSSGALTGVDTDAFFIGSGTEAYATDDFWLQLISNQCDLGESCPTVGSFAAFGDPGYLYRVNSDGFAVPNTDFPAKVTFGPECKGLTAETANTTNCRVAAAVPEPATLGLLGAALALLCFWRNPRARRLPSVG